MSDFLGDGTGEERVFDGVNFAERFADELLRKSAHVVVRVSDDVGDVGGVQLGVDSTGDDGFDFRIGAGDDGAIDELLHRCDAVDFVVDDHAAEENWIGLLHERQVATDAQVVDGHVSRYFAREERLRVIVRAVQHQDEGLRGFWNRKDVGALKGIRVGQFALLLKFVAEEGEKEPELDMTRVYTTESRIVVDFVHEVVVGQILETFGQNGDFLMSVIMIVMHDITIIIIILAVGQECFFLFVL